MESSQFTNEKYCFKYVNWNQNKKSLINFGTKNIDDTNEYLMQEI